MSKLKLTKVVKDYKVGNTVTHALKGVSLEFRKSEFVSILGPSGCGKTTMLNIIGGLDQYDSGDLIINDMSTKDFKDSDWDAYRNRSIGFVFQSYNLIAHQTVLQNVEISMTLSGVSSKERTRRAKEALESVQLGEMLHKRPNQLSGGQMQRVAIARALVNNPDIILADEPTGALDSHTSIQIMNILKEISQSRLVIIVTHNGEMAEQYSSRVIRILDGEIVSDSNPVTEPAEKSAETNARQDKKALKKTSMSMKTAISLSFKNLLTKKARTLITSIAGSIGIVGVATVLALSNGLNHQISELQTNALAGFPITISTAEKSYSGDLITIKNNSNDNSKFPDKDEVYSYDKAKEQKLHANILTQDYINYVNNLDTKLPGAANSISYTYKMDVNVLTKSGSAVKKYNTLPTMSTETYGPNAYESGYWNELPGNKDFVLSQYDLIGEGSKYPTAKNEVLLVVNSYNRIDDTFFKKIGMDVKDTFKISDLIGLKIAKVIPNNDYYSKNQDGTFKAANEGEYSKIYDKATGVELTVTGILRIKEDAPMGYLDTGIAYTPELTTYMMEDANKSDIAVAQKGTNNDVFTGVPFMTTKEKEEKLMKIGSDTMPSGLYIYPKDFDNKEKIKSYLDDYNKDKADTDKVLYEDLAEATTNLISKFLDTITLVLVGFAAISLVVSSIMIGIITYVSVIERTKEIGILRSVGARKIDISRVFNAETLIVGFAAGTIGVIVAQVLTIPINAIANSAIQINNVAQLTLTSSVILVLGSMVLTLIAGFIPSKIAAKKDPVVALRTE